jgi:hypothetical protein
MLRNAWIKIGIGIAVGLYANNRGMLPAFMYASAAQKAALEAATRTAPRAGGQ